jgi:hypothetical protein
MRASARAFEYILEALPAKHQHRRGSAARPARARSWSRRPSGIASSTREAAGGEGQRRRVRDFHDPLAKATFGKRQHDDGK